MLNQKTCVPCQGGIDPLSPSEIEKLISKIDDKWEVKNNKKIQKEYNFNSYREAISFVNKIADLAEKEGHHPYIHINFKNVIVIIFTHKIDGLHENDFILASKYDLLIQK